MKVNWQLVLHEAERSGKPFHEAVAAHLPSEHDEANKTIVEDLKREDFSYAALRSAYFAELLMDSDIVDPNLDEMAAAPIYVELADFIASNYLAETNAAGYVDALFQLSMYYSAAGMVAHARGLAMGAIDLAVWVSQLDDLNLFDEFVSSTREALREDDWYWLSRRTDWVGTGK